MKTPALKNKQGLGSPAELKYPMIAIALAFIYIASGFIAPKDPSGFNLNGFSELPVLHGGRVKPLDTVARTSLLMLRGKQTLRIGERRQSASEWLLDALYFPQRSDSAPLFEIDDPDVLGSLGILQSSNRYYSFDAISPSLTAVEQQAQMADQVKPDQRSRFQRSIIKLQSRVMLYQKLQNTIQVMGEDHIVQNLRNLGLNARDKTGPDAAHMLEHYQFLAMAAEFRPLPDQHAGSNQNNWSSVGQGILNSIAAGKANEMALDYAVMGDAYRSGDSAAFNGALSDLQNKMKGLIPEELFRVKFEKGFNQVEPFYRAMALYLCVFLLTLFSWFSPKGTLRSAAFYLILFTFAVHTTGLASRMVIQGRPPVTNLYSSAIFVGWMAVLLAAILERLYKNGMGNVVGSVIGFSTLIIAHHLAVEGDTLEMMRAVLDSNFWLATHVVCITIGYSSTFLAGFLAIVYIIRRRFSAVWDSETADSLERMVYGIVCFSAFFSFLGTVLGGIWADQSWGRFWGWDPKENGALMIVLWNAFILHARMGGIADQKKTMLLAVFGNVITALSWFGVNMLGIGLHSYGFMDQAFVWLTAFSVSQIAIIALGAWPDHYDLQPKTLRKI